MNIAVIGPGAIGGLIAGYLKEKKQDVYLVGRREAVAEIKDKGLRISGVRGDFNVALDAYEKLPSRPDLLILATKTQDIEEALKGNLALLKDTPVLTTQNGVRAEEIAAGFLPKKNIVSSIVMFGSTYLEPGKIVHNFEGSWILGSIFNPLAGAEILALSLILDKAFPVIVTEEMLGMKYLKIFVNASNCIPAILGLSMQEAFADQEISRVSIAIWREGLEIISQKGIGLVSLPGFPVENLTRLLGIPGPEAAKVFSGIMVNLSKDPLYGSVLQSIKRGRASEIDYINGEFVSLAQGLGLDAPLNRRLVGLVHAVEEGKRFFTKEEFLNSVKGLVH